LKAYKMGKEGRIVTERCAAQGIATAQREG
jgi:hypothetical protein